MFIFWPKNISQGHMRATEVRLTLYTFQLQWTNFSGISIVWRKSISFWSSWNGFDKNRFYGSKVEEGRRAAAEYSIQKTRSSSINSSFDQFRFKLHRHQCRMILLSHPTFSSIIFGILIHSQFAFSDGKWLQSAKK